MFRTGLTTTFFKDFISDYQSISQEHETQSPFIYVDENGVKLVTSVLDVVSKADTEVCALTMAEDGWMEIVSLSE